MLCLLFALVLSYDDAVIDKLEEDIKSIKQNIEIIQLLLKHQIKSDEERIISHILDYLINENDDYQYDYFVPMKRSTGIDKTKIKPKYIKNGVIA